MNNNSGFAAFLGILGSLLQNEPSEGELSVLIEHSLFKELPFHTDNERILTGQEEMNNFLGDSDIPELTMRARIDYAALFAGPGKATAAPWASCFMGEKLTFQAKTLEIRSYYKRYDREIIKKNREPDDHIGYELEFAAYLLGKGETDAAFHFSNNYMRGFVDRWSEAVRLNASTGYYRGLAHMAAGGVSLIHSEVL
jgi:TorA maturation chaperone TorD